MRHAELAVSGELLNGSCKCATHRQVRAKRVAEDVDAVPRRVSGLPSTSLTIGYKPRPVSNPPFGTVQRLTLALHASNNLETHQANQLRLSGVSKIHSNTTPKIQSWPTSWTLMPRAMRLCTLAWLWCAVCLPGVSFAQAAGNVTDQSSKPLSDVHVWSGSDKTDTDATGHFEVRRGKIITFSKPGYRPLTTLSTNLAASPTVVLQEPANIWRAPNCAAPSVRRRNGEVMISGDHMRFVVPSGLAVRDVSDIDYSQNVICVRQTCLEHGWGPLWTTGYLVDDVWVSFFSNIRQMTEREIYDVPHDLVFGEEYRGARTDGTFFRWAGVIGESIGYDKATRFEAEMFDAVIDSLCWF